MNLQFIRITVLGILLSLACGALIASEARHAEVSDAWMREVPPGQPTSSGFLVLHNHGDQPIELVSAELTIADVVELHTMSMTDQGQMSMRQVDSFVVPPGDARTLAPRGDHLMFMRLDSTVRQGDRYQLTLRFADGSSLETELIVRAN